VAGPLDEEGLIARYFAPLAKAPGAYGLLDDAAVLVPPGDPAALADAVVLADHPDQRKELAEIAVMAHLFKHSLPTEIESGLAADQVYDHPYTTMPSEDRKDLGVFNPFMGHACHIPVVEVDVETGLVKFLKYTAVHDAGTLVNPRSLNGHIIGGTAQGIGTALFEEYLYDDEGQLANASYQDYLIPSAMDVPELVVGHQETPSPYTVHGIKGGGEGGRMMAPAAVASAIEDALKPLGVRVNELPATPERVLGWIEEAKGRND
jgi:CO/xanthine dehydrogenase Mo-binding subunit